MKPPIANKINYSYISHNNKKIKDEYAWLRDTKWPNITNNKITEYLNLENQYCEHFFFPLQKTKNIIFNELKSRIKLSDESTYVKKNNYYYFHKTNINSKYLIYCRKNKSINAKEEIILDINNIAKNSQFINIGSVSVSSDDLFIAYSVDFIGNEQYTIKIINLITKNYLSDEIKNASEDIIWHEKLKGFFYILTNKNMRCDTVMFHYLNNKAIQDVLVFSITNPLYQINISKSLSKKYIIINVYGYDNNEIYIIKMNDYNLRPLLIKPLQQGVFYELQDNKENFYIKTNKNAKNFRIVIVNINNYLNDLWENNYISENENFYLSNFAITKNYLILNYIDQGLPVIKIKCLQTQEEKFINFPDEAFSAYSTSTNFENDDIRVIYSTLAQPTIIYNYNFIKNELSILKIQEIPSGFNTKEYQVKRIFANFDKIKIPITLLYKKSLFKKNGENPLYLYAYGSYGISVPVSFCNNAISLVNRGFLYAIAHVRGGDDLGYDWYKSATLLNKKKTFKDFIAVSKKLIKEKYTSYNNIVICGGSAGGLLIGAVINKQPQLFKAAIAHVPFVDVLNTMLDEELPLTPGEFQEWGNPKEKLYYDYIKSYSPYENIKKQKYPNLFVTTSIFDTRVGYWEAAKWIAKIRAKNTSNNMLLLKTEINSGGHKCTSNRFKYLHNVSDEIAFILQIFNKIE